MQSRTSNGGAYSDLVPADEQLERRLGALEARPLGLQPLDQLAQLLRIDHALEPVAELLGAHPGIRLAAELRHDEAAFVAHEPRVDVLVAHLDLGGRGAVDAALVRERGATHVRLVIVGVEVDDLGDVARQLGQHAQPAGWHDLVRRLQLEIGEDRDEVGVSAPLAVAVDGSLDVAAAGGHGGERVGDRQLGVVVAVDAPRDRQSARVRVEGLARGPDDVGEVARQGAAVGVAHHQRRGPGVACDTGARDRVGRVVAIAVKIVLEVVDHLAARGAAVPHRVADHREVLVGGGAQHVGHMQQPRLADQSDDGRAGVDQRSDVRVVLDPVRPVASEAERRDPRVAPRHATRRCEEVGVLGVRARPAALNEGHAKVVEAAGNLELVGHRHGQPLALGAVAKGRVVEEHGPAIRIRRTGSGHLGTSFIRSRSGRPRAMTLSPTAKKNPPTGFEA